MTVASTAGAMTVQQLLSDLTRALSDGGVTDPPIEARDILSALLEVPRFWPVINAEMEVDARLAARAHAAVRLRRRGAPVAYAVGRAGFRHLTLEVDERVLIPRPETEQLVELVLTARADTVGGVAIDVGTGSGAIALSLAAEGSFERVVATDISIGALAIARRNAERCREWLRSPVEFVHGSLLGPLAGVRADVIVSNPPYIALDEAPSLPASVRDWEPSVALFSGENGVGATARLVRDAATMLVPGGLLAMEVDTRRASLVAELVSREMRFDMIQVELDLTGRERFVLARRQETTE